MTANGQSVRFTVDDASQRRQRDAQLNVDSLDELDPGHQAMGLTPSPRRMLDALPDSAYDGILIVAIQERPLRIESYLRDRGCDLDDVDVVLVSPLGQSYEGDLRTALPVQPADLTGIGMRFADTIDRLDAGDWVLVDAIGPLLPYATETDVYQLLQMLTSVAAEHGIRGGYGLVPGTVDELTYNRIRGLFDAEVALQ